MSQALLAAQQDAQAAAAVVKQEGEGEQQYEERYGGLSFSMSMRSMKEPGHQVHNHHPAKINILLLPRGLAGALALSSTSEKVFEHQFCPKQEGYMLSIHYLVLSSKGGTQMDIGMTLKVGTVVKFGNCD